MNSLKTGWRGRLVRPGAVFFLVLGLMAAFASAGLEPAKGADEKEKLRVGTGFSQAMLATQLALQGEQRKSAIMLLAAAELLMDLKESGRPTKDLKVQGKGLDGHNSPKLTPADLVDKARQFARGNKDLSALVENRAEQLTSRGLEPRTGEDLPTLKEKIGGITFKVLGGGKVPADGNLTMENIRFVAGRPAIIAAVGASHQDLLMEVRDEGGEVIRNPPKVTSRSLTLWLPGGDQAVSVRVHNEGAEEIVALIANWD